MNASQVIVLAVPVFLLMMLAEWAWGLARGRNTYRLNDALGSLSLGLLSQIGGVFTKALSIGVYILAFQHLALWRNDAFWMSGLGWLLALVFYDFCYYWLHRMGHEVAVLWAAHSVHHQSQDYNLSTALRQTSSGSLLGWIFYLPMALAGVPPLVFGVVALIDLLYQFWVHTEHVGKLGWFDRWFCSPSNHRVHHAVNDRYLDKNYGGIFIVWDRLFGTFEEESERCVYGVRGPLDSLDPLWANGAFYWKLLQDSWHARRWRDKLNRWLRPPGWRPADVAERFPTPAFDMRTVQRYDPSASAIAKALSALQFLAVLAGALFFLWHAERLLSNGPSGIGTAVVWLFALGTGLWSATALVQGRIRTWELLYLDAAVLATACASVGLVEWHRVFKPLPMLLLMAWVARSLYANGQPWKTGTPLLLALLGSLAGDVFLMLPGNYFIPGLLSFLLAHLAYIAVFKQAQIRWFPSRGGLLATLLIGGLMYAVLWTGGLPAALRVPVAAYVLVIALMAAQAIGRARVLRTTANSPGAVLVAVGAGFFMVSDGLLAINKFVTPLPLASLWVLATYFLAQLLIVRGWLRGLR